MPVITRRSRVILGEVKAEDSRNTLRGLSDAPLLKRSIRSLKQDEEDMAEEKSWFEQRRSENLKANAEFLASLNINETKSSFNSSVRKSTDSGVKKSSSIRGLKSNAHIEPREYELRPRTSLNLRSRIIADDVLESIPLGRRSISTVTSRRGITEPPAEPEDEYWHQIQEPVLAWGDNLVNKATADTEALAARFTSAGCYSSYSDGRSLKKFVSTCRSMSINDRLAAKVTPKRIFSLDIHPSNHNSPLVAAGDKWGYVGFWNVSPRLENDELLTDKGDDGVCLFKPHTRPVNCTLFSSFDNQLLYTSSYDGTVRRCDVSKQSFSLLYRTAEEIQDVQHMYMSEVNSRELSIASTDGTVTYLDTRNSQPSTYDLKAGKLKCISHHPIHSHYFITGSVKGRVDLWDYRYISSKSFASVVTLPSSKGVLSAYFSPLSGDRILSCTADDQIKVYSSTDLSQISLSKSFHHNNYTGRWLSNFRASWHPSREDCFLLGSMKHPRQIELFDCEGNLLHSFGDNEECLQSVTSLNVFHPRQPVVAGANSSGRVYLFMDQRA